MWRTPGCTARGPPARALAAAFPLLSVTALLLLALAVATPRVAGAVPTPTAAAFPIDASVVLLFAADVDGGAQSECGRMARRAMATGGGAVNFVITGYYIADPAGRVVGLGYREGERDRELRPHTWESVQRFGAGLAGCMRVAAAAGFSLAVHAHLDDGGDGGTWRNALDFDPYTKYPEGLSYYDALIAPAAEAVAAANVLGSPAMIALQAEMGATLFYYPRAYRTMARQAKAAAAARGAPPSSVRVGVNLNWEKVCGCPAGAMSSTNYYALLQSRWRDVTAQVDQVEVQALFQAVDWIGISAYAGLPAGAPAPSDLEESARRAARELRLFGVDLGALGKDLVYSEFGVGGGETANYRTPARDWAHAAAVPYWGVDGRYDAASDPWARPGNRDALRRFFDATLEFAAAGGGPTYRVKALFLWSIISFDVTGVHYLSYGRAPASAGNATGPATSGGRAPRAGGGKAAVGLSGAKAPGGGGEGVAAQQLPGSYRDPVISAAISAYNSQVMRMRRVMAAGATRANATAAGNVIGGSNATAVAAVGA